MRLTRLLLRASIGISLILSALISLGTRIDMGPVPLVAIIVQERENRFINTNGVAQTRPQIKLFDLQRRLSAPVDIPTEDILSVQFLFGTEPTLRIFTYRINRNADGWGTSSVYGFHDFDLLSGDFRTLYQREIEEAVAINGAWDFELDLSMMQGMISFYDPGTHFRYLLDTRTGALSPLHQFQGRRTEIRALWWAPTRDRFAYVQEDGSLAIKDLNGQILNTFPEINFANSSNPNITWPDNGRSLFITSFSAPDTPIYYRDATTGEPVDPRIDGLEGYYGQFRKDCTPALFTYLDPEAGSVFLNLETDESWTVAATGTIDGQTVQWRRVLPACSGFIYQVEHPTSTGSFNYYLSDMQGQNIRLLQERVKLQSGPSLDGSYVFGEVLGTGETALYSANIYTDAEPVRTGTLPDLSYAIRYQAIDAAYLVLGSFLDLSRNSRLMQLVYLEPDSNISFALTEPAAETVIDFRYYAPD